MRRALWAAAVLLAATAAVAETYPSRPIRIIVPTPAGGPVDVMARLIANALPPQLGQNVVVENKPGAGNTIGSKLVAQADPDGYTLMVSAASGLIMSPMIIKSAGYDASSFTPVALIAETPQVLARAWWRRRLSATRRYRAAEWTGAPRPERYRDSARLPSCPRPADLRKAARPFRSKHALRRTGGRENRTSRDETVRRRGDRWRCPSSAGNCGRPRW